MYDILLADTNLTKINVNLIDNGWVCSKMAENFYQIMRLKKQVYLKNGLMNQAD